ncbi:MAG: sigma-70 family RNA polymerase sigma factor [Bacteroidetes bacterium]|nr:sigma-70 family RNA polymerase sigma factor [Bacteroidota bacterium]
MKNSYSDKELLHLFNAGENPDYAFSLIVRRYQEKLYWHIRKIVITHEDANDVIQETFIKAWHNLGNFRGDSKLFTWLFRIATNEALSHLKHSRKKTRISFIDLENKLQNMLEGDNYFDGDETQLKFQKAILTLPEKQRLVFNMKYFDEMKYDEIAEILGTSVGALKASYHHAVKKIKETLIND